MPLDRADVSVVVPAWRAAGTIGRTLASIAMQTRPPKEVILVDDGSDDDTVGLAESWRDKLNGISLIVLQQKNQGAGAARNLAVQNATSAFLAFLDADDEWMPEKLERSLSALESNRADLVFTDMQVEEGGQVSYMDANKHLLATNDPYSALCVRGFVPTSTVIVRRDAVVATGGFDPSLRSGQDYELWLRLLGNGLRPTALPEALTLYHVTKGSITARPLLRLLCNLRILFRQKQRLHERGAGFMLSTLQQRLVIIFAEALIALSRKWAGAIGALWLTMVLIAYYAHNLAYYREKLGVFGRFFLGGP